MAKRDYYDVLGVARTATADHIRSAYRKLARKYHPDVNKAPDATTKFKEATEAYEVLSDQQKRQMYDQFGHAGPSPYGPGGQGQGPGRGGARSYTWSPGQGQQEVNFEDIFGSMGGARGFGGMSLDDILESLGGGRRPGRRGHAPEQRPQPSDMQYDVNLDFMQAIHGSELALQMHRGEHTETISVKIPPGVGEGSRVRVRGKGGDGGDLYIVTHIGPHPYFRRDGDDIYVEVPISITEAALGAKVDVPTVDGMTTVTIPPCTSSARKLRLREKGVAGAGGKTRGDQYVVIKIVAPPSVSAKGAELLRQFEQADKFDARAGAPWK